MRNIPESVRNKGLRLRSEKVHASIEAMISLKKRNIIDGREKKLFVIRSSSYISNHDSAHTHNPVRGSDGQIASLALKNLDYLQAHLLANVNITISFKVLSLQQNNIFNIAK
jgi:hypothetical protein